MSGHSKWSKVKRQKQATDTARSGLFTKLANAITIAVHEGGNASDPQSNFKLRIAIEKARASNMPKANIERAILKAAGKTESGNFLDHVVYEGFAPGRVAVLCEGVTDNKQRTAAAVKNAFTKCGGTLGVTGSVSYLFRRMGAVHVVKETFDYDQMLSKVLEVGGDDLEEKVDKFIVYCKPDDLKRMKLALEQKTQITEIELIYRPINRLPILDKDLSQNVSYLLSTLEGLDDIHRVYTNAKNS